MIQPEVQRWHRIAALGSEFKVQSADNGFSPKFMHNPRRSARTYDSVWFEFELDSGYQHSRNGWTGVNDADRCNDQFPIGRVYV